MPDRQARIIARETAISMVINAAISALMTWLLFGGASGGAERSAVVIDFAPQTFMVALMGSLVPSVIVLRKVRGGVVGAGSGGAGSRGWFGRLVVRCLLIALGATILLGGSGALLVVALLDRQIEFPTLLVLKIVFGTFVAALVTPMALRMALNEAR